MKRFILAVVLAIGCGGMEAEAGAALQSCRIALGSPQGCLVVTGSCSCSIAGSGADVVISFPASVSTASVAWVEDTGNEQSIVTAKTTVQAGAVHLSFALASGPIPALNMGGWRWDISAQ